MTHRGPFQSLPFYDSVGTALPHLCSGDLLSVTGFDAGLLGDYG